MCNSGGIADKFPKNFHFSNEQGCGMARQISKAVTVATQKEEFKKKKRNFPQTKMHHENVAQY